MSIDDILSSDPDVVSGAIVFRGTRVPVETLFEHLAHGGSLDLFLADFPTVSREQAKAALALAAEDIPQLFRWRHRESAA